MKKYENQKLMKLPLGLSFGVAVAACKVVDEVIVIDPFVTVEMVADALVATDSVAAGLFASSAFDAAALSSFATAAVLFVRILDGDAL